MELYVAMAVGAMTSYGAAKAHTALNGRWWLSLPAGVLGGLAGKALWMDDFTPSLEGSTLAATAVAAALGGAALGIIAAVARNIAVWRMRSAPQA
jgi:hypothetical protein